MSQPRRCPVRISVVRARLAAVVFESQSFVGICSPALFFEARRSWSNRRRPPDSPRLGWIRLRWSPLVVVGWDPPLLLSSWSLPRSPHRRVTRWMAKNEPQHLSWFVFRSSPGHPTSWVPPRLYPSLVAVPLPHCPPPPLRFPFLVVVLPSGLARRCRRPRRDTRWITKTNHDKRRGSYFVAHHRGLPLHGSSRVFLPPRILRRANPSRPHPLERGGAAVASSLLREWRRS